MRLHSDRKNNPELDWSSMYTKYNLSCPRTPYCPFSSLKLRIQILNEHFFRHLTRFVQKKDLCLSLTLTLTITSHPSLFFPVLPLLLPAQTLSPLSPISLPSAARAALFSSWPTLKSPSHCADPTRARRVWAWSWTGCWPSCPWSGLLWERCPPARLQTGHGRANTPWSGFFQIFSAISVPSRLI